MALSPERYIQLGSWSPPVRFRVGPQLSAVCGLQPASSSTWQPGPARAPHSVQSDGAVVLFSPLAVMCRIQRSQPGPRTFKLSGRLTPAAGSTGLQGPQNVHPSESVLVSSVRRPEGPAARCRPCSPSGQWHVPYGSVVAARPIRPRPVERPGCPHIHLAVAVALAA